MNWDQVQGSWKQFKGQVKQKWGDLTDDEIDRVEGRQEELAGLIQKKFGKTHEEARARSRRLGGNALTAFLTEREKPGTLAGLFRCASSRLNRWISESMSRTCKVSMKRGPFGSMATRSSE